MKAILFDLDGTLINSADDIALSLKLTLEEIGMLEKMPPDVRKLVGGGAKALLERVLGEDFKEEYVAVFRKHYKNNPVVHTKSYKDVPEVLRKLRDEGIRLAVVTNKLEELSIEILKRLDLLKYFDLVVGGDTFEEKKPSPVPLMRTLEFLNVRPEETLMVGDTETDILAGKGAGTKTALALWGYVQINSIDPDLYLNTPLDLLSLASQVSDV